MSPNCVSGNGRCWHTTKLFGLRHNLSSLRNICSESSTSNTLLLRHSPISQEAEVQSSISLWIIPTNENSRQYLVEVTLGELRYLKSRVRMKSFTWLIGVWSMGQHRLLTLGSPSACNPIRRSIYLPHHRR